MDHKRYSSALAIEECGRQNVGPATFLNLLSAAVVTPEHSHGLNTMLGMILKNIPKFSIQKILVTPTERLDENKIFMHMEIKTESTTQDIGWWYTFEQLVTFSYLLSQLPIEIAKVSQRLYGTDTCLPLTPKTAKLAQTVDRIWHDLPTNGSREFHGLADLAERMCDTIINISSKLDEKLLGEESESDEEMSSDSDSEDDDDFDQDSDVAYCDF